METDTPKQMQHLFPEGYYFCYVLHGLTWVEAAIREPTHAPEAIQQAKFAFKHLESADGKAPFDPKLPPDHGMFYSAWKAHLLAGIVLIQNGESGEELNQLQRDCDSLATAFKQAQTPFLASYPDAVWPCDSIPAIHAMKTYDSITGEQRYQSVIDKWLADTRDRLDPATGLIPHVSLLPDGRRNSVARATSQMILLRMLPDLDAEFAKQQYEVFRERFLTKFIGIPCVFEYPDGSESNGDIDSGPLIFGRSLSATVFMIGTAQVFEDQPTADAIAIAGETVGLPWTTGDKKSYVGGVLPIGDIMVTYSHNARPWFDGQQHVPSQKPLSRFWRIWVHAISLLFLVPTIVLWRVKKRRLSKRAEPAD